MSTTTETRTPDRAAPAPAPAGVHHDLPARLAAAGAVLLLPWTAYLSLTLPSTYTTSDWAGAWLGFDAVLVVVLAGTAVSTRRRWPSAALWATAAGAVLLADAWFDTSVSTSGTDRAWSLASLVVEVPVALVLLVHGRRELSRALRRAG